MFYEEREKKDIMDVANRDITATVSDKNLFKENGRQLQTEDVYEIK